MYKKKNKLSVSIVNAPGIFEIPYMIRKNINKYKVECGSTLEAWEGKGWIVEQDPYGWFQWYCRFSMGRRIPRVDIPQIKRWKNFRRHVTAVEKNCEKGSSQN